MPPIVVDGPEGLHALVGSELGASRWVEVTQELVDAFADATLDRQWIHVEPARAAAGPFGGTVAHGFLTLSLGPALLGEIVQFSGFRLLLNYGLDRVRFPAPLPVGSRVRLRATLASAEDVPGGVTAVVEQVFEREGAEKPVCAAVAVYRLVLPG